MRNVFACCAISAEPPRPKPRFPAGVWPNTSFEDLVGAGEDGGRHGQAERLGGVEVDHQLEPSGLLDRQIGRRRP
jgi:hypothetical protein